MIFIEGECKLLNSKGVLSESCIERGGKRQSEAVFFFLFLLFGGEKSHNTVLEITHSSMDFIRLFFSFFAPTV